MRRNWGSLSACVCCNILSNTSTMEFTSQQLMGGPKYSSAVRLGNFSEDLARAEAEARDYERRRATGDLLTSQKQRRDAKALAPSVHSASSDGYVHYGDTTMLKVTEEDFYGKKHVHYLANNIWDIVDHVQGKVAASATPLNKPVARNTWVIGHPSQSQSAEQAGDVLHYGDRFYLCSNPSLRADPKTRIVAPPYYLSSERSNNIVGSGSGNRNEVSLSLDGSGSALWTILPANGDRLAYEGLPVPINEDVQVVHCATNQPLGASLDQKLPTDFGPELNVHAFFHKPVSRWSSSTARPALAPNRWQFVAGESDISAAISKRSDYRQLDANTILERVRTILTAENPYGVRQLHLLLRKVDDTGEGALDREDMKWGLFDLGVKISDEEFKLLLDQFDRNKDGVVSMNEILESLRGNTSDQRLGVIREAWDMLSATDTEPVTLKKMENIYDAKFHPSYGQEQDSLSSTSRPVGMSSTSAFKGSQTLSASAVHSSTKALSAHQAKRLAKFENALNEFIQHWGLESISQPISWPQFLDYYLDLSASIDSDTEFDYMMRQTWNLEGCEQNEDDGSKRLQITFKSGRQQEVIMPPETAHGIDDKDQLALVEALEEDMNILGVYRVKVLPNIATRY